MINIKTIIKNLTFFDKLIITLAVLGIIFFAYIFFRKSSYLTVTIKVGEENILYGPWLANIGTRVWFNQLFYEGMTEVDGIGRTKAEVLYIHSYDKLPSRKAVYMTIKLKVVYNRASNQFTFKGNKVLIGTPIRLELDSLLVEGLVTHIEGVDDPREKVTLIIEAQVREETPTFPETSGTREYVAQAIKSTEEVKDDQGNIIIKFLDTKVENAKKIVTTSDGRVIVQTNPLRKDVYLTLQVEAIKIHNRYFLFDDIPLLIGHGIPINSPTLSIWPEVTEITEID